MPKEWHDFHSANQIKDEEQKQFYKSIIADKKPYFMIYIYPALLHAYNSYIKDANYNCLREFQLSIDELQMIPYNKLTDRQKEFLKYFDICIPVGTGNCTMNKICKKIEQAFDGYIVNSTKKSKFDYTIMKSDSEYTQRQYYAIEKLYNQYNKRLKNFKIYAARERIDEFSSLVELEQIDNEFRRECETVCPNRFSLCNIVLDLCYTKSTTKRFAWSMCKDEIIDNLLKNNNYIINAPIIDADGDIYYNGNTFKLINMNLKGCDEDGFNFE